MSVEELSIEEINLLTRKRSMSAGSRTTPRQMLTNVEYPVIRQKDTISTMPKKKVIVSN
jgi:hypothetical protein